MANKKTESWFKKNKVKITHSLIAIVLATGLLFLGIGIGTSIDKEPHTINEVETALKDHYNENRNDGTLYEGTLEEVKIELNDYKDSNILEN